MTLVVSSHALVGLEGRSTHLGILHERWVIEHSRIDGTDGADRRVRVVTRLVVPSERLLVR